MSVVRFSIRTDESITDCCKHCEPRVVLHDSSASGVLHASRDSIVPGAEYCYTICAGFYFLVAIDFFHPELIIMSFFSIFFFFFKKKELILSIDE